MVRVGVTVVVKVKLVVNVKPGKVPPGPLQNVTLPAVAELHEAGLKAKPCTSTSPEINALVGVNASAEVEAATVKSIQELPEPEGLSATLVGVVAPVTVKAPGNCWLKPVQTIGVGIQQPVPEHEVPGA